MELLGSDPPKFTSTFLEEIEAISANLQVAYQSLSKQLVCLFFHLSIQLHAAFILEKFSVQLDKGNSILQFFIRLIFPSRRHSRERVLDWWVDFWVTQVLSSHCGMDPKQQFKFLSYDWIFSREPHMLLVSAHMSLAKNSWVELLCLPEMLSLFFFHAVFSVLSFPWDVDNFFFQTQL